MNATIIEAAIYAAPLLIALAWLWHRNTVLARTLEALRSNAFLTDERGVRVKYANASCDVRAKAEQN